MGKEFQPIILSNLLVIFIETRYSEQIEAALNRDLSNLLDTINLYKYESFSLLFSSTYFLFKINFRIWLIQERVPSLLAHLNCNIYTRIPSVNSKHELIASFTNNSVFIELIHNQGFYVVS